MTLIPRFVRFCRFGTRHAACPPHACLILFQMKSLTILLTLAGLAGLTAAIAWTGFDSVLHAVSNIGFGGFLLTLAFQLIVNCVLGAAWHTAFPEISFRHLLGARMIRDAAGTCLPFSQVGGMVIGTRATCLRAVPGKSNGVGLTEATCANIVDITTEVMGQIAFILLAVTFLIAQTGSSSPLVRPVLIGAILLIFGIAGFVWTQRRSGKFISSAVRFLGRHIAGQWQNGATDNAEQVNEYMERAWSRTGRIAAGAAIHLIGWIGSAGVLWLTYKLLHADLGFAGAIAIEGVACGVMSASFLVPAGLGVQEGAYMTLGAAFGIDPTISLGISLLRRARELSIGIPVLAIWQISEMYLLKQNNKSLEPAETTLPSPSGDQHVG
ncbi:MAG: flippase-like domain-containing protein [Acetobacter sp.]|jgi:putative membrane protein